MKVKYLFTIICMYMVFIQANCTISFSGTDGSVDNPFYLWYNGTASDDIPAVGENIIKNELYYEVGGLTPGSSYYIDLYGLSGNVNLEVYSDSNFTKMRCASYNPGSNNESCLSTASGSSLFFRVLNPGGGSVTYSIDLY